MTQIMADALGVPVADINVIGADTDLTEDAGKSSASRQTFVSGRAAQLAGQDLRKQILQRVNAGDNATIELRTGHLVVREHNREHILKPDSLPAADDPQDNAVLVGRGRFDPPTTALDNDGQGAPYATYGFAAQIAQIEVDVDLGTIKVAKIIAAHDVGKAVNPTLVEGQIEGGVAQGIGLALMEEFLPGKTENLHDYLIPSAGDVPPVQSLIIEDAEPLGPFGAKGIGEPALIPTAPAIVNALYHATGVRMRDLPLLPHRVFAALNAGGVK
jgi:CO/xanthine dehydrogenase Mo-binding subunit